MKRIPTIALCIAALIAIAAADARAQSADAIAGMCANYARQSWPDQVRYNDYQRPRQQVYINCMMEHGLRP